ncbi:hypothetical protein D3C80_1817570 [compost metagenome]
MAARWDKGEPFNWALLCRSPCCDATRRDQNVEEKCVSVRCDLSCAHLGPGVQGLAQDFTGADRALYMWGAGGHVNAGGTASRLGLLFVEIVRIIVI